MTLQLREGGYYKTRDGRKAGPAKRSGQLFEFDGYWMLCHAEDGSYRGKSEGDRDLDLIAEWTDGPVRTVTRREVVEGVYGRVEARPNSNSHVVVGFTSSGDGKAHFVTALDATELKAAAAVLLELAGALEG